MQPMRCVSRWLGPPAVIAALGVLQAPAVPGADPVSQVVSVDESIGVADTVGTAVSPRLASSEGVAIGDEVLISVTGGNHASTADAGGAGRGRGVPGTSALELGSAVELSGSGSDADGDPLAYAWDLDHNGTFEMAGQNVYVASQGGVGSVTVTLQVCDDHQACATDDAFVRVVAPPDWTGETDGPPGVSQTPELGSLGLLASGLAGLSAYACTKLRAATRKRRS